MNLESLCNALDICLGHGKCTDCEYHSDGYSDMNCRGRLMYEAYRTINEQTKTINELTKAIDEYIENIQIFIEDTMNLRKAITNEAMPMIKDKFHWYCGKCSCRIPQPYKSRFCAKCGAKIIK